MLGLLFQFGIFIILFVFALIVTLYVLEALFLNKFNKLVYGKGTPLAWIPFANLYLLGKLTINTTIGWILLGINILTIQGNIRINNTNIHIGLPENIGRIMSMISSMATIGLFIYAIIKYFKIKKEKKLGNTNNNQQIINNEANNSVVINQPNTNTLNNQNEYEILETLDTNNIVSQNQIESSNIHTMQNIEPKSVEQIKKFKPEYMNKIYVVIILIALILCLVGLLIFFGLNEEENNLKNKTTTSSTTTQKISSTSSTTTIDSSISSTTTNSINTNTTTTTTQINQIDEDEVAYNAVTKYLNSFYVDNYLKTYKIEDIKIVEEIECYNLTKNNNKLYVYIKITYEKINSQLEIIPKEEKINENEYSAETYFIVNKTNNSVEIRKNVC